MPDQWKDRFVEQVNSPAPWCEWVQVLAYLLYGLNIIVSNGAILHGELHDGSPNPLLLWIGIVMFLLGLLHAYGAWVKDFTIRWIMAAGSALLWSAMLTFYLTSHEHKVGWIACFLFLLMQIKVYLWVRESHRRDRVAKNHRSQRCVAFHYRWPTYLRKDHRGLEQEDRRQTIRGSEPTRPRTRGTTDLSLADA